MVLLAETKWTCKRKMLGGKCRNVATSESLLREHSIKCIPVMVNLHQSLQESPTLKTFWGILWLQSELTSGARRKWQVAAWSPDASFVLLQDLHVKASSGVAHALETFATHQTMAKPTSEKSGKKRFRHKKVKIEIQTKKKCFLPFRSFLFENDHLLALFTRPLMQVRSRPQLSAAGPSSVVHTSVSLWNNISSIYGIILLYTVNNQLVHSKTNVCCWHSQKLKVPILKTAARHCLLSSLGPIGWISIKKEKNTF